MNALLTALVALASVAGLAGCATNRPAVDAQWADPQLSGTPLRGARVLVACEAAELVLARLCLDRLSAELVARGASPVPAPDASPNATRADNDSRYLTQARGAGAKAIVIAGVNPDTTIVDDRGGSGFSIGLGGFGFGRHSGVGVGVSMPVGGNTPAPARYAANARVIDAANGRLLWTARAASPPAGDANQQIGDLVQRLVGAAGERLF